MIGDGVEGDERVKVMVEEGLTGDYRFDWRGSCPFTSQKNVLGPCLDKGWVCIPGHGT